MNAVDETELAAALRDAFTPDDLERRVLAPLNVPENVRSGARSVDVRIKVLVEWAKAEGKLEALVKTAWEANRSNVRLAKVAEAIGLSSSTSKFVEALGDASPEDKKQWEKGLVEIRRQVCWVETDRIK